MSFISGLSWNHLLQEKGYQMPSAQIIRGQLTEDSTNSISEYIRLNPDMTFQIKVVESQSLDKRLSQFDKGPSSSEYEKAQFRLFRLRQIFGLNRISTFLSNLIINLVVTNSTFIKLTIVILSFIVTIKPDSTLLRLR